MMAQWNIPLVALSFAVATLSSFMALELIRQLRHGTSMSVSRMWLVGGSFAMGLGGWSMHFVGMLAWEPSSHMSLTPGLTLLSLLLAVASAGLALRLAAVSRLSRPFLLLGGAVMGAGIASMHYTGMAAMQLEDASWHYDIPLVLLSVVVAVAAATTSLRLFRFHGESAGRGAWYHHLLSALFMGLAVCGMHYTGMAAMVMEGRPSGAVGRAERIDSLWLAVAVAATSLAVLILTLMQLLKSTHRTLGFERMQVRIMLNAMDDGVLTVDQHGCIRHANPTALALAGVSEKEAGGQPFTSVCRLKKESDDTVLVDPLAPVLERGEVVHLHSKILLHARNGARYAVELKASPLRERQRGPIGAVVIVRDVSFRQEILDRLEHQAMHDSLTGLYNRRAFDQAIQRFEGSRAADDNYLLLLDLDDFKLINDSCGHGAGDEILRDFAGMLGRTFEAQDFIARLGGDEFAILLSNRPLESVLHAIERLRGHLDGYSYEQGRRLYTIGASIGLTAIDERFESASDIMIAADRACYSAKCSGRNQLRSYQEGDSETLQRAHEVCWLPRLREALRRDRFVLYAQRIEPMGGAVPPRGCYYEVLLRYIDDDGRHTAPGAFMPAAERSRMMPEIDRWVIDNVCRLLSQRPGMLGPGERLAVNLSGQSLTDETLAAWVLSRLSDWQVSAEALCFEITETAAIAGFDRAREFMETLRLHGCEFALDDFGSGMSSFAYLAALPIQHIKIDGAFIRALDESRVDRAIVTSISSLGRSLGLSTIAECVENDAIRATLEGLEIDYVQGYGVAMPEDICRLFDIERPLRAV